jgi:hypothetical protein
MFAGDGLGCSLFVGCCCLFCVVLVLAVVGMRIVASHEEILAFLWQNCSRVARHLRLLPC